MQVEDVRNFCKCLPDGGAAWTKQNPRGSGVDTSLYIHTSEVRQTPNLLPSANGMKVTSLHIAMHTLTF